MKVDVTKKITELDGTELTVQSTPIQFCDDCNEKWREARKLLTLRLVCTRSLTAITNDTQNLSGQEKFERAALARKIFEDNNPSLSVEDVALLKQVIGKVEGPLVVLQAYESLDPPD